jgi:hypothetical protein
MFYFSYFWYCMVRKILLTLLLGAYCSFSFAQYTQIGSGFFSSANFGPVRSDTTSSAYSKFAFMYPSAALSTLQHGDTIRALSFYFNALDSLRGNCNMRILLSPSSDADFGFNSLNWDSSARSGMVAVFNGNPKEIIGNIPGEVLFPFQEVFRWDTTGGAIHLKVFVEYIQSTNQTGIFPWNVENGFSVPNFVSANESKFIYGISNNGIDSFTNRSSVIKPTLKLYHPSFSQDIEVNKIYSLGTVPILMRRADTIKAMVTNVGRDSVSTAKIYLSVRGTSTYLDSTVLIDLPPYGQTLVKFGNYTAQNIGTETLAVRVEADDNTTNDSLAINREANYNVYSHNDPFSPASGGIGFNSGTGDFVAKFYVDGTSFINQITVDFNQANRPFQLVVWDDDGINGLPGTELFVSDTSQSVIGTFIMPVLPRISISGGYYVGIRQTSNTNVSFTYQDETPIRPHTFYFTSPAGNTVWTNFDPGFNFNFNVRPRLQVANDVAVLDFVTPIDGDSILYSETDSIDLVARIINFGYQNQGSCIVRGQIYNRFNTLEETRNVIISLPAEDTATVDFGKLSKYRIGKYTFRVTALLALDSVIDNNQAEIQFDFVKEYDVAVDQIFGPSANERFDIHRDPLQAVVRLANYGVKSHTDMPVVLQLVNSQDKVVYTQAKLVDLGALTTTIFAFDTTYLTLNGDFTLRAYTDLASDSFRINDTMFVFPIKGTKSDDVLITHIATPSEGEKFAKNASILPFVRLLNDGINNQDKVVIEASILNVNGEVIYYDSLHQFVPFFSIKQALFKPVLLDSLGDYTLFSRVTIDDDQLPINDTASARFSVVTGNDLRILAVLKPQGEIPINTTDDNVRVVVYNAGLNDAVSAPISVTIEDNTGTSIYSDSINATIPNGNTDTLIFKTISFGQLGDYYITCTNNWLAEDEPLSSDTLTSTYITRYGLDVGLVSHILPVDTIEIGEVARPRFSLLNSGLDTAKNIRVEIAILDGSNMRVFIDTVLPPNMAPNTLFNVNTNETWSWNDGGLFTLRSTLLNADDNVANDVFTSAFVVAKRRDISVERVQGPAEAENVLKGSIYKPVAIFKNDGLQDISGAEVICEVKVDLVSIYRNRQLLSIASGTAATIEFDSFLSYPNVSKATAEFWVEYTEDQLANNDTLRTTFNFVGGVGVEELDPQLIEVYPNPYISAFDLRTSLIMREVSIKNDFGVVVWNKQNLSTSNLRISLEDISSGTYFLEIKTDFGVVTKPLLKQ